MNPTATRAAAAVPKLANPGGHPWWTLASVALGVFMVGLDGSVVVIANPKIAADLHASLSNLQWITNAYLLALATLLVLGGKLGDRFGRRLIFMVGVIGFAATSVGIGLIGSVSGVIALRALQGVFGALLMPNTLAILRAAFPANKLNAAIGIWGGASAVSVAAGPIIGGILVEHVNWESVFYVNAPIAVITVAFGLFAIRESRSENRVETFDLPGTATLAVSLFMVVYGLVKAQEWGWTTGKTLAFIIGGAVLLGVFVIIELRSRNPLLPMRLFTNRSLSIGSVVVLVNFFAMFGVLFFLTLFLQSVQGFSPIEAGVRVVPLSVSLMVAAPVGGLITERIGPRAPMVAGLFAAAAAMALLTRLEPGSSYSTVWPALVLLGLGIGFVMTSSSDAIIGNADVDDAGIAGGLQSTALQLGGVMGTAILGSVMSQKVGAVLIGKLAGAGVPIPVAEHLLPAKEYVAQGVAPAVPGMPDLVQRAIVAGCHEAFMTGLHSALWVGMGVLIVGALFASGVRRGENSGKSSVPVH
ncbi:MFS transporter [Nocardia miyunensis]|uniref:MFS transporter n=1 Tax=Nocardia miyunensis TaxID=282684 RepID=UPI000A5E5678|nr:MFS transporter [Nocardia miyunensis]